MTGQLIALGGKLRAGKDAVADYLVENHGYVKMGMSDALNEALQNIGPKGPWIKLDFNVYSDDSLRFWLEGEFIRYRDLLDAVGYVEAKRHRDVREYLQGLGTEVGRDMIDPDVWVHIAEKKIHAYWDEGKNVVITAMRFPNEIDMVKRMKGLNVWVERPDELRLDAPFQAYVGNPTQEAQAIQAHASETSVSSEQFDYVLNNDGTLEQLHRKVEKRLVGSLKVTGEIVYHPAERVLERIQDRENLKVSYFPPYDR